MAVLFFGQASDRYGNSWIGRRQPRLSERNIIQRIRPELRFSRFGVANADIR